MRESAHRVTGWRQNDGDTCWHMGTLATGYPTPVANATFRVWPLESRTFLDAVGDGLDGGEKV
jgi:hypothetical protein